MSIGVILEKDRCRFYVLVDFKLLQIHFNGKLGESTDENNNEKFNIPLDVFFQLRLDLAALFLTTLAIALKVKTSGR